VAYKILYKEDSLADLVAILDYISADNPSAAERFGTALLDHVELLQIFPRLGAPVSRLPEIRKFVHSPIRVYYCIHEDKQIVEILHFWHGSRSDPKL
jgi:plasmid stabilization system protein ParE